jgi:hypothetical protein
MAARKKSREQGNLLKAVARKLGHAAGALTKMTQGLKGSLTALPQKAKTKGDKATRIEVPASASKTRAPSGKTIRKSVRKRTAPATTKRKARSKAKRT